MKSLILAALLLASVPAFAQPAPATYDFAVGTIRATALKDGGGMRPNDGKIWADTTKVARLLAAAGQRADTVELSIQPLLVRTGRQIVLIDTGNGGAEGGLAGSLARAGVAPSAITDVVISHPHGDHVGGLMSGDRSAFSKARIHIAPDAWSAMQAKTDAPSRALAAAIAPQVVAMPDAAVIAPGLRAVALRGHTPGHSGVDIRSGGARLFYVGDMVHSHILSLADPELTIAYDADAAMAQATRRAVLTRAARERTRIFAVHFPFPGLGTVRAQGGGFVWVAERAPPAAGKTYGTRSERRGYRG